MEAILSISVIDTNNPPRFYESSAHRFFVKIFHMDGGPLFYDGVDYGTPQMLQIQGKLGRVHGSFKVPPGTYFVQVFARCYNVTCQLIVAEVTDGRTTHVYAVPTSIRSCFLTAMLGARLGSIVTGDKEVAVAQLAPKELHEIERAVETLMKRLPYDDIEIPLPTEAELKQLEKGGKEAT